MARITIESVTFSHNHPFRKFQGLLVPFAAGITLICGHNGIGKSTILGLLASCSGLPTRAVKTYLGKTFNANIGEIIYIDFATEIEPRLAADAISEPLLTYSIGGAPFQKKCSLTRKKGAKRARSVPRSVPYEAAKIGDVAITKDQKVPLPTLYLGMIRMLPVGEVLESRLSTAAEADWHEDDKRLVERFMGKVIARRSRSTLPASFARQNSARVAGSFEYLQPACMCQKHPWTKIATRLPGRTMSGEPGRSFRCSLKR